MMEKAEVKKYAVTFLVVVAGVLTALKIKQYIDKAKLSAPSTASK